MRKLQAIEKHDQEVKEAAQADIDQTIAWRDRKLTENESSREYFHGLLKDYLYRERQHDSKFKIDTPHGKVTTRKTPAGLNYDETTVLKSLRDQGIKELIKTKETIKKTDLKKSGTIINGKFVLEDGQIVDGVTEKPASESVKFSL